MNLMNTQEHAAEQSAIENKGAMAPTIDLNDPNIIVDEGFIYDRESGEVLGEVPGEAHEDIIKEAEAQLDRMRKSGAAVNAARRQYGLADDELQSLITREIELFVVTNARAVELMAIKRDAEAVRQKEQRKLDWIILSRRDLLLAAAKKAIGNGKTKTWKSLSGAVSYVTRRGTLQVEDHAKAVKYAREHGFAEAIKEELQISKVPESAVIKIEESMPLDSGFKIGDGKVTVSTEPAPGVKLSAEAPFYESPEERKAWRNKKDAKPDPGENVEVPA